MYIYQIRCIDLTYEHKEEGDGVVLFGDDAESDATSEILQEIF